MVSASEHSSTEDAGERGSPGATGGWTALGAMKDRATMAKNQLGPQLLNMKQRTSKRCALRGCVGHVRWSFVC